MRRIALFFLPLVLSAQSPESDRVTQTLISEIQQLRMALERSTVLNARTQLAISQLQLQEQTIARITTQLNDVKNQGNGVAMMKSRLAEAIKDLEQRRMTVSDPKVVQQIEMEMKNMKSQLEQAATMDTARSAREGELTVQLQQAQSLIAASRARIDEMERALDAAIQQMLKK